MVGALPVVSPDLAGDCVLLTPWEAGDLPRILELADEEGKRWSRSLAGVRTLDDARRWVAERSGPDRVDWVVRDPATRSLIGRVGLHRFQDAPRAAEVGYGVHPAHRGRGVASAAVATALTLAFDGLGLRRVELLHDVDNVSSCAVAARSGFALEGVEREALGYPDGRVGDLHRHARLSTDPPGPVRMPPLPLGDAELTAGDLVLRAWRPDDAPAVTVAFTDPEVLRWADRPPMSGEADARRWIEERARRRLAGAALYWAVLARGVVVGSVGLRDINRTDSYAVASYWTMPTARGRGVAGRALARATAYAVEELGLHRVQLAHAVANTASCRVAEKAGFALEGILRGSNRLADGFVDEHLHARLAGDS